MWKQWREQPSCCVVGTNIWAGTSFWNLFVWVEHWNHNPAWVLQSAEASQPTGWPCVASHISTEMTHRLSSIFNSLDASPSNVPILLEKAARENGREKQAEVICNYTEWIQPPTSFHCTHTLRDNEMEGYFFFLFFSFTINPASLATLIYGVEENPLQLDSAKSRSINTSKHPLWVVNSIW